MKLCKLSLIIFSIVLAGTDGSIRGKITDQAGDPLPGQVIVLNESGDVVTGTSSDFDGNYIILNVQEKQLREFNLGLRWDNYYDLVATANVQLNSPLLPGLRIEDQILFAGIRKNIFSIYYRRTN